MKYLYLILICLYMTSSYVLAQSSTTCANEGESYQAIKSELKTVGKAKLKVWFWNVYNSKLYTNTGHYKKDNQCILFEIDYLRTIKKEDLIHNTIENWQHIGIPETSYQPYIETLESMWPEIKEGDQLALKVVSNKSEFYYNGKPIGVIDGHIFGPMFLQIWLSKKTTQPKLRKKLLGES